MVFFLSSFEVSRFLLKFWLKFKLSDRELQSLRFLAS